MPMLKFYGGQSHGRRHNVALQVRTGDSWRMPIIDPSYYGRHDRLEFETYIKTELVFPDGTKHPIMALKGLSDNEIVELVIMAEGRKEDKAYSDAMPKPEPEKEEIKLRWYQEEAVDATVEYFDDFDGHPVVVVPTGAGKTIILCEMANQFMTDYPGAKILVLSHVKEILQQDHAALSKYFDGYDVGLWSAGLKSKTKANITVAGIQSVYRRPDIFKDFNFVIIDECHLINHNDEGMYRNFLNRLPKANYIGLTATHFRLGHGYIHEGKNALFTDVVYDLSSVENFNRLVKEGYLSRLISKATDADWDTEGVRTRGGDFRTDDLSTKFDREKITDEAVKEIIKYGKNYKAWLVFAIDIEHAEHIASKMNELGIKTACVHSKMKEDRSEVISAYKRGHYRCMVNVDILTTGFDVPHIDLIAMLRPTKSPVLHVQAIGRGLRVAEGKDHCLVLDFAGNTERLGPINNVVVRKKGEGKGNGEPITKRCPECDVIHHPSVKECDVCGHVFKFKEKIKTKAGSSDVVQGDNWKEELVKWHEVDEVQYYIHQKKGKPSSLKVTYLCGLKSFSEWVCIDHPPGFAKHKADNWVRHRAGDMPFTPDNLQDLYKNRYLLKVPKRILVDSSQKFASINDSQF